MKNYEDVIGIDVSKLTLDASVHKKGEHAVFTNDRKGYIRLLTWSKKKYKTSSVFYCF